jgi:hypothetical protein
MAHTPGPWEVKETPESSFQNWIVLAGRFRIVNVDGRRDSEAEANAYLIAAAPNLLAALRELADAIDENRVTIGAVNEARALIAKAEGK